MALKDTVTITISDDPKVELVKKQLFQSEDQLFNYVVKVEALKELYPKYYNKVIDVLNERIRKEIFDYDEKVNQTKPNTKG